MMDRIDCKIRFSLAGTATLATFLAAVPVGTAVAEDVAALAPPAGGATQQEIQQFCTSIADPARDQRYLLQKQELEKLQAEVDQRIGVLEQRKAEYEDWLKRRNDFMQQAEVNLVEIYKNMKADAAAPQLEKIDPVLAAAIVMKLPARQSSQILSEMNAEKAAIVAGVMSSAADPTTSRDPS
ncbi:flagellar motility protein MotE (MotC chaperone) [Ciceribacter lividus]|uniref:Flagellar motility protein MotE (MotC chaperone) n=1 Tax=Ciceribacter lividus TaxID=1197950 RepID=A0A6I7HQN5_9HYPH|nr:MotE family protein [Ciceribacter lividus]RCW27260.1 flagellar motility protein MotE (MotC chaperone) [Ciceribacter lividus]